MTNYCINYLIFKFGHWRKNVRHQFVDRLILFILEWRQKLSHAVFPCDDEPQRPQSNQPPEHARTWINHSVAADRRLQQISPEIVVTNCLGIPKLVAFRFSSSFSSILTLEIEWFVTYELVQSDKS